MLAGQWKERKRDGRFVDFEQKRVYGAIAWSFCAEYGVPDSSGLTEEIDHIAGEVSAGITGPDSSIGVEAIQGLVEEKLMQSGYFRVTRRYIVCREEHKRARALGEGASTDELKSEQSEYGVEISVARPEGSKERLDPQRIRRTLERACRGLKVVEPEDRRLICLSSTSPDSVGCSSVGETWTLSIWAYRRCTTAVPFSI